MKPSAAHSKLQNAIKQGKLTRPEYCELCGVHMWQVIDNRIVGHHWRGYDYPLDVWWVCSRCNNRLRGKHDGSLTKEQAQAFIYSLGYSVDDLFSPETWGVTVANSVGGEP